MSLQPFLLDETPHASIPVVISSLQKSGVWKAFDENSILELEGYSYGLGGFVQSHVLGATNRGNVELIMSIFHSKTRGQITFIDIMNNHRSRTL